MQNIFNFVWKYQFTLIFLLLELIAFILLAQSNNFHNASVYSKANAISGGVYESVNNATEYIKLQEINDELSQENAFLREGVVTSFIKLKSPTLYIDDTLYTQRYKYITAKVINSSTQKRNNFIVLNQGFEQDIKPEMGVITKNGIVGIVKDVSDHFCTVITLLHKSSKISAKFKKNNYFGILSWKGGDPTIAYLSDIPSHVNVAIGDVIISRGSSTIFPEGLIIGTIDSFEKQDEDNFYDINVKLSTDFSNVNYVHIVKNLLKKEQIELEKLTENSNAE
jgi:rod shape-determining protein MreC